MTKEEIERDFQERIQMVLQYAKDTNIEIGAVQQLNQENLRIECVPVFYNLAPRPKVKSKVTKPKTSK